MRLEKSRSGMHHLDGRFTAQQKAALKQKLFGMLPPKRSSAAASAAHPAETAVAVDYPRIGERVVSRDYTIRVSTKTAGGVVEVSIDDEAWLPCREAAGFWWYDWSGYHSGRHTVFVRISPHKGRRILSAPREFVVDLP
jgi:hypothetical protein